MKNRVLVSAALFLMFASPAFAATPAAAKSGPQFEQNKARHLQQLDANIKKDSDLRACTEKAQSHADMQACRGKQPKGTGKPGPRFAENKAKTLQHIDARIKLREDRKACIAKAANHADIKTCQKGRSKK